MTWMKRFHHFIFSNLLKTSPPDGKMFAREMHPPVNFGKRDQDIETERQLPAFVKRISRENTKNTIGFEFLFN
jgi:hypothetical protein